jgi:uncharacterized membrane protein (DUF2068 family)
VRLAPKHWNTQTWWCSIHDHVAPAASANYPGRELQVGLADGSQLARCLRCDAWVHTVAPPVDEPERPLPEPLRGKALDEFVVIRAIALERGLHVLFFLALAGLLILLEFGLPALQRDAQAVLPVLDQTRSGQQLFATWLNRLISLDGGHVWVLAFMAIAYAALESVECVFLWRGQRWAEYLTVVATAAFLPLEIYELTQKVSALRVGALLVNLAILAYLLWTKRLFGVRGGLAGLERELAEDVDWESLHSRAPVTPTGGKTPGSPPQGDMT